MERLGFEGDWKDLFGNPTIGFNVMIKAPRKNGKSTLMLQFAEYLARNFGPTWYAAIEEGLFDTFTEKRQRLGIGHPDLRITNFFDQREAGNYDFIVIDSVNRGNLKPQQVQALMNAFPHISFLLVFQQTKSGSHRGSEEFAHDVDYVVEVIDKVAYSTGRTSPDGELAIKFGDPELHTR